MRNAGAPGMTAMLYDKDNRLVAKTNPDLTISTCSYAAEGSRRTRQETADKSHERHEDG